MRVTLVLQRTVGKYARAMKVLWRDPEGAGIISNFQKSASEGRSA